MAMLNNQMVASQMDDPSGFGHGLSRKRAVVFPETPITRKGPWSEASEAMFADLSYLG